MKKLLAHNISLKLFHNDQCCCESCLSNWMIDVNIPWRNDLFQVVTYGFWYGKSFLRLTLFMILLVQTYLLLQQQLGKADWGTSDSTKFWIRQYLQPCQKWLIELNFLVVEYLHLIADNCTQELSESLVELNVEPVFLLQYQWSRVSFLNLIRFLNYLL